MLNYTGTFNFASITDPCTQWQKTGGADAADQGQERHHDQRGQWLVGQLRHPHRQRLQQHHRAEHDHRPAAAAASRADSISIEGDSSGKPNKIWIDHNTIFSNLVSCSGAGDASFDGAIDNKKGATNITYSYNYIHDHQKVALNGHTDNDTTNDAMRVTYHHNRFENVKARLPLQRRGRTHIYNNYFGNVGHVRHQRAHGRACR